MTTISRLLLILALGNLAVNSCSQDKDSKTMTMKINDLTPEEEFVILHKGTERPFTGEYYNFTGNGTYLCKHCDAPLYRSSDKFESHCGWPSFDDEIPGSVKHVPDADGQRTEIVCARCGAHLGHVFEGEGFTSKNTRHCVNSISMKFVPGDAPDLDTAYLASGCFWGTQYWLQKAPGVVETAVGYMGGSVANPSYRMVCTGTTGHAETVQVIFDTTKTSYENILKIFFETHDQSQVDRQGPDVGEQYRSEIFYRTESQEEIATKVMDILESRGFAVATRLNPATEFWKAEDYHQDYYEKKHGKPYCHVYQRKF